MALTKQSYCNRITNIIKTYVIPELLRSGSPELESFALQVNENSWGLHAFRHWFTVQLVLDTDNPNTIASFRGDASILSAYAYLQNKGELVQRYEQIGESHVDSLLQEVNKIGM